MAQRLDIDQVRSFRYTTLVADAASGRLELGYELVGDAEVHHFTELVLLGDADDAPPPDPAAFERAARLLWLTAGLSYYKAAAPPRVEVPGGLTDDEREYVATVIRRGLGEFAYVNRRVAALTPEIVAPGLELPVPASAAPPEGRALVAVGGGKDSIVAAQALVDAGDHVTLFAVNGYEASRRVVDAMGLPLHLATRTIDPALVELNARGALNGHVPVTAVNSVIGVLVALRSGYGQVVFANERSASVGNTVWEGHDVNHQWSKSLEFERLLRRQLEPLPVDYFSLLRPLSELRIMRHFARLTRFHDVFISCNRAFRLDPTRRMATWCGDCPKCRFVHLALTPWLGPDELLAIFGHDLFADPAQQTGFEELLGLVGHKPLECVGEVEECRVAVVMAAATPAWAEHPWIREHAALSPLLPGSRDAVFAFDDDHCLSPRHEEIARAIG